MTYYFQETSIISFYISILSLHVINMSMNRSKERNFYKLTIRVAAKFNKSKETDFC